MFRITEDPSSGSLVQCLVKKYKNDSIVPVDMGQVGVMAAYSDRCACVQFTVYEGSTFIHSVRVCSSLDMKAVPSEYAL